MPDNKSKTGVQDRSQVAADQDYEVRQFAETHGVYCAEEECLGKKIVRAYRTDSGAPDYPSPVEREEWYRSRRRNDQ